MHFQFCSDFCLISCSLESVVIFFYFDLFIKTTNGRGYSQCTLILEVEYKVDLEEE